MKMFLLGFSLFISVQALAIDSKQASFEASFEYADGSGNGWVKTKRSLIKYSAISDMVSESKSLKECNALLDSLEIDAKNNIASIFYDHCSDQAY